jgi:Icc-related predicted phosphoesterase
VSLFKRKGKDEFSLFYVADIHGSERCFRKFVNAAKFYGVDAVILGGDITGKALVPLIEQDSGDIEVRFMGEDRVLRSDADIESIEKAIRFNGFYPFRIGAEALSAYEDDDQARERFFASIMADELRRWLAFADERLGGTEIDCLAMPGNDDESFTSDVLHEAEHLVNPEDRIVDVGPYQVLSLGYSNITPWHSPRELSEQQLEERLTVMSDRLDPDRPAIYNIHVPPHASTLDDAPEIRSDLTVVGGSGARMVPVGSPAVRAAIERDQPMLGLHGHIHESRGAARIGRSVCVNPGSEYNTGVLRGVIVRLRGNEVTGTQFVAA